MSEREGTGESAPRQRARFAPDASPWPPLDAEDKAFLDQVFFGATAKTPWELAGGGRPAHRHSFYRLDRKRHWNDLFERAVAKLPESHFAGLSGIIQDIVCLIEAYPDIKEHLQGSDGPRVVEELVRREGFEILYHPDVRDYVQGRHIKQMRSKSRALPESRFSLRRRGERGPGKGSALARRSEAEKVLRADEKRIGDFEARVKAVEGKARRQEDGERMIGFQRAVGSLLKRRRATAALSK